MNERGASAILSRPTMNSEANDERVLQVLGLAVRAGQVLLGHEAVLKSIQTVRSKLVLVAGDAGSNSAKKYRDKCRYYETPVAFVADRGTLGHACGKPNTVAVSVLDEGFAKKLVGLVLEIYGGEAFGETSGL